MADSGTHLIPKLSFELPSETGQICIRLRSCHGVFRQKGYGKGELQSSSKITVTLTLKASICLGARNLAARKGVRGYVVHHGMVMNFELE